MLQAICVLTACADREQATAIAEALVSDRLAACVNVLPGVESIYRWQGQIERASEVMLLIKTTPERFAEVRDRIQSLHSYDTPEIIALPIVEGLERYLAWLQDSVGRESAGTS
ncbi:MAG TPA: divalent-cation tolerance protein CutA [Bryobacteraceae bacterium]|jgi:periplasmic divalent cation tolerance protein|nr:divalent-cation tolerance protein CutA [Bryobacteraceae bacterium]